MKRRTFLKSVLGVLVLPVLPKPKAKISPKIPKKIRWRRYAKLEAPAMPLTDGIEPINWKMWHATRILDDSIHVLAISA